MRPFGVTLLSILIAVSGVLLLIVSIALLTAFATLPLFSLYHAFVHLPLSYVAVFFMLLGAINLILAYGLWFGMRWAWFLTLVFSLLGLISSVFTFNVLSAIIYFVVIYYLFRPYVKEYFGVR
ncbi:MAG: hypothetical protein DRJ33_06140 [Candidatus Methanomethylicota archaeon]|uniref:Uncharacterized protein n=1 Tax=Thermoproteota archaeon TaxID=2056631 RepID=A0A497EVY4_9CREN|nr:MAG: hypothetical protein DRJ33_06140 [Candidatus Verstraetearchaeota archaeon]